jgi:hypothetical protein
MVKILDLLIILLRPQSIAGSMIFMPNQMSTCAFQSDMVVLLLCMYTWFEISINMRTKSSV